MAGRRREPQIEVAHRRILQARLEPLLEHRAAFRELHPRRTTDREVDGRARRREIRRTEPEAHERPQPRAGRERVTRAEIELPHAVVGEVRIDRHPPVIRERRAHFARATVELRIRRAREPRQVRVHRVVELRAADVPVAVGAGEIDVIEHDVAARGGCDRGLAGTERTGHAGVATGKQLDTGVIAERHRLRRRSATGERDSNEERKVS